jgi:hypothetical protein
VDSFKEIQWQRLEIIRTLADLQAYLRGITLESLLTKLKAQGMTQMAFAEGIGINPHHLIIPVFQTLLVEQRETLWEEDLNLLPLTHTTVTRECVWTAVRRTPDVRLREREHRILLLRDGKSCPAMAPWLYRDEETMRRWVRAFNEARLPGLERTARPGHPRLTHVRAAPAAQGGGAPVPPGRGRSRQWVDHPMGPARPLYPLRYRGVPGTGAATAARPGGSPAAVAPSPPEGQP